MGEYFLIIAGVEEYMKELCIKYLAFIAVVNASHAVFDQFLEYLRAMGRYIVFPMKFEAFPADPNNAAVQ